jgi:hypothetical protein
MYANKTPLLRGHARHGVVLVVVLEQLGDETTSHFPSDQRRQNVKSIPFPSPTCYIYGGHTYVRTYMLYLYVVTVS